MLVFFFVAFALASLTAADNLSPGGTATRCADQKRATGSLPIIHALDSYWDCCKPSGAIVGKAPANSPVRTCAKDGSTALSAATQSACVGGSGFACFNTQPFVSSSNSQLSYAFGARSASNDESSFECGCYALTFSQLPGKTLVVQTINDGGDVPATNFDIAVRRLDMPPCRL